MAVPVPTTRPPINWGNVPGQSAPFDPNNQCCNAPCPPGAGCNTQSCAAATEFYRRRWVCQWSQTGLQCADPGQPDIPNAACAWTKVWRCTFEQITRAEVLAAFCDWRQQPRCPAPDGQDCNCFVPPDQFFAKVYEMSYEECPPTPAGVQLGCIAEDANGNPLGCACCGLFEKVQPRWVRITSKADIPASFAMPPAGVAYYEPQSCTPGARTGQGTVCTVGRGGSPDLSGVMVF